MFDQTFVELSRWQFAATAMYHFIFVPLTLGLAWLLVIMETVYVMTGKEIYRDMTKFWGKLFGHQLRSRCHHRSDHGVPVRNQLVLLFALCRRHLRCAAGDRRPDGLLPRIGPSSVCFSSAGTSSAGRQHLGVTFLTGARLQPVGPGGSWLPTAGCRTRSARCSRQRRCAWRCQSFSEVLFNPVAQVKFVHTVAAGYTTASMFVLGISSWYLLKGRDIAFAKRSFAVAAAGFGLASCLSVIVLGD